MAAHYLKNELYELIKQDESIFDFIQEGSLDGLWYWDLENPENEWMNPRFWEVLGYKPEEMPHKASAWQDIINQDDLKLALDNFHKHAADPSHPYDQEVRYTHKNGSTVWIRCRGLIIRDKEGKSIRMLGAHQDITGLKNAQNKLYEDHKQLKENEELFRFLTENTTDVIRYQDASGKFTYISPNIFELTGYSAEEYSKFGPLENVVPEDYGLLEKVVEQFKEGELNQTIEYRIYHKNGQIVWLESRIKAIRNVKGETVSLLSSTNNISERKQLQLNLVDSEEKYKAMYNNAPLAFQSLDINGHIVEVNPQWLKTLEYTKEEVIGSWFGDFLHPDFVEHFRKNFPRFKAQGFINDVQFRMKKKNGEFIYVSFEGCIGFTPEGKFKQTYCTFKDITNEKVAALELKQSEEKYRLLAQETADNLNNLKAATNITTIFLDKNLEVFEFSPGDHMKEHINAKEKTTLKSIALHYKIENIKSDCQKVLQSLEAIEKEVACTHGLIWWMRISPYKTLQSNIDGLVITLTDISEKKQLDNEVKLLSEALENSIDAYDIVDENGKFIYVNKAYLQMWGYNNVDEVIGMSTEGHCADPEIPAKIINKVMQDGKAEMEFKALRKNGTTFDVLMSVTKFVDSNGKVYFPTFAKDITEKKQQERELKQYRNHLEKLVEQKSKELVISEARYKHLVETAVDAIYLVDEQGIVIDINPRATEILEKSRDEIIGQTVEIIDPNFPVKDFLAFWKPIPFDETHTIETTHIGKSGIVIPIEIRGKKYEIDGKTFYYGIARDVSERKKAEKEQKNQRDLFELVINSVPSFIFWKDRNLNYLGCNKAFSDYANLASPNDIIGKSDYDMVWAEDADKFREDDEEIIKSAKAKLNYEETVLDKKGQIHLLKTNKMPLKNREGKNIGIIAACEDVTNEKKAQNALKESEKLLLEAQTMAQIGNWTFNPKTGKLFWSKVLYNIYGLNPENGPLSYADHPKLIHPDDWERFNATVIHTQKTGDPYDMVIRIVRPNGDVRFINSICKPLVDSKGKVVELRGSAQDVTERIRTEKELEESRNLLRSFIDNFPDDAWAKGIDGRMLLVNQFVKEKTFGHDDVIGKTVYDFFPKELSDEYWASEQDVLKHAKTIRIEEQIPTLDGIRSKVMIKFPLYDANGKIMGLGSVAHDITERKKAEIKIRKSEEKFRGVFEDSNVGIALGSPEGTVLEVNDEYLRMMGYSREEFINLNYADITHPDDLVKERLLLEKINKGEIDNYRIEKRLLAKNGKYVWLDTAISCRKDTKGNIDLIIALVIDITVGKRATETVNVFFEQAINLHLIGTIEGEIIRINEGWVNILGYSKKEVVGKNIFDFIHPDDVEATMEEIGDLKEGKRTYYFENRYRHKNGKYISLAWSAIYNTSGKLMHGVAKDITKEKEAFQQIENQNAKLKQTNQQLLLAVQREEESNDRFNKAMEATSDGIWDWNLITNQIYFSPRWKAMLGYREDELSNDFSVWEKLTEPEAVKRSWKMLNQLINGEGEKFDIEFKMKHKKGYWVDINSRANVFFNAEGKASRVVGTHTDISARKIAEKKLRESEQKLRLAINNSPLGITLNDMKGNFISVNKAYEKIVGYSEKELLEMKFFDITHPDYLPKNQELFSAMASDKAPGFAIDKKYIHKNGKLIDVRVHAGSIQDDNGEVLFGMAFTEDITEQKALEQKNIMLSKAIESSPVIVIITNKKGDIEYVNPFFTIATGYSKGEVIGQNPRLLQSGNHSKTFYQELWDTIKSGKTWQGEFHNRKKNGELYWENAAISPVKNKNGEIIQFIAVKEDISQLKESLSELKLAKDKAEESNRLKNEFLHNMSHEIRTPMNGIMGFSNLLSELDDCSETQTNYTTIIHNCSTQLLQIIDDILEISTLETKQLLVQNSEFDLNQFIMELFAIYDLKSKERNTPIYVKKGLPNSQSKIISDKTKLQKILSNLLDNAFKFTNSGKIEFGYSANTSKITFFVRDTGIGISDDKKERIFLRFSQESTETAQLFGGLGLGLSIAKENAELLGGSISVKSKKGAGTTFFVEIPYMSATGNSLEDDTAKTNNELSKKFHILIAEDENVNFLYLEAILETIEDIALELHHAINGEEAINECLKDDKIDLVLMDIKMPVVNGYLATEKIKASKPDLPIIAQTAYSTTIEKEKALESGCDDFISKPIQKELLLKLLNNYLLKK